MCQDRLDKLPLIAIENGITSEIEFSVQGSAQTELFNFVNWQTEGQHFPEKNSHYFNITIYILRLTDSRPKLLFVL